MTLYSASLHHQTYHIGSVDDCTIMGRESSSVLDEYQSGNKLKIFLGKMGMTERIDGILVVKKLFYEKNA